MKNLHGLSVVIVIFLLLILIMACNPAPEPTPTPAPTPTERTVAPRNENVEALNSAQATLNEIDFGFAPLLLEDEARVVVKSLPTGELARLEYLEQPADPTTWKTVDSFVSAFATRAILIKMPHVSRVALGSFGVPASVGNNAENIEHIATWVTFADRSRAIVDLTPLSTNFAARHTPDSMIIDETQLEAQFADRRLGVDFNSWRPMTIVRIDNEMYYLLGKVTVTFTDYEFALRIHPVKPANPMEPMQIRPGMIASVAIDRTEFSEFQEMVSQSNPTLFNERPELLSRIGSSSESLMAVFDDHVDLLWHLITKFEHKLPDPQLATPTLVPTATPSPTPTPTPTPTRRSLPLETS